MSPRTGRPKIDNPKSNDTKVRLDDELHERLLNYCKKTKQTKAEVIRQAIIYFLDSK